MPVDSATTFSDSGYAERGAPSFVWRAGQQRRLEMIREWTRTTDAAILIDGIGVGMYAAHLLEDTPHVYGFDIEFDRVQEAVERSPLTHCGAAEYLPYPDNSFDTILSHEVLEHVADDAMTMAEMARVLKPGGRIVLFCPNRWYPFETHGHYWRGEYHFGNTPLINYLPDTLRDRLAPHVRAYRWREIKALIKPLPLKVAHHTRIYGGYDNIIARYPTAGRMVRDFLYLLEGTPLRQFGLSHLVVIEKVG